MTFEARGLARELGGRVLYRDLAFRLEKGRTLVVRGPSGSGKTQLLRQLGDLDSGARSELRQEGGLTWGGRSPEEWGGCGWRAEVCCVPQVVPALTGTPAELELRIAGLRAQRGREAEDPRALAQGLGLGAAAWEQPWGELSVGERQRLLLAVLLSRAPGVLLLDEPTAALDEEGAERVEALLKERTCVWVTHSAAQAERVADATIRLEGRNDAD